MKTIIFFSILFCIIALPAFGALTDADLDKIRLIVNDSEKRIKAEVKAEITALRQELKAEIAGVNVALKTEITKSEKNVKMYIDGKIEGIEKQLSTYGWVIYILMPLLVAGIGIPTAMMAWRSGKDRSLERQIETLTQEVETLKQQRIVNP